MKRVVFVRDKTNKHSIRALLAAYEKWFPEKDYYVLTPQDAFEFLKEDDLMRLKTEISKLLIFNRHKQCIY